MIDVVNIISEFGPRKGGRGVGVFSMIQTVIKNILRKIGNYPSYAPIY